MKLYRCDLCGRVFGQKTPHKCYGGCFRKHCLTYTEFEDVDDEYIKKSEVDVKEKLSTKIWQAPHILTELPASNIEYLVNWEQRRYDIAKDVHRQMLDWIIDKNGKIMAEAIEQNRPARNAVFFADALIAELKKEK